jgi:hypothetical protein
MRLTTIPAILGMAILISSSHAAYGQDKGSAQILFESANRERTAHGLALLKWSATLAVAAEQHVQLMAAQNTLSHQLPGEAGMADRASQAGARFSSLAENVAEGPSAQSIHRQWMDSPPHRANLLDAGLDSVGIAVAERNGVLFAVEDFSLAAGNLSVEEQEGIVSAKLRSSGLRLLSLTSDARRSCVLDNGYAGSHVPSFVLHYATSDLQTLPELLTKRIQTGKYHSAVVGACASDAKLGFSNYRIAVLLFDSPG